MISGTLGQPARLLLSLAVGIVLGLLLDMTLIPRTFKRGRKIFTVLFDVLYFLIAALVYICINYYTVRFEITVYMICGNIAGFFLERKSVAILLAKFYKMVYNLIKGKNVRSKEKTI